MSRPTSNEGLQPKKVPNKITVKHVSISGREAAFRLNVIGKPTNGNHYFNLLRKKKFTLIAKVINVNEWITKKTKNVQKKALSNLRNE